MPLDDQIYTNEYFDRTYGSTVLKGSHPFQYDYWIRYLHQKKPVGRLIDVGCGLGFFIDKATKYYFCHGIDASEYAITAAKKRNNNASLSVGDANSLNFGSDFFDIITCFDVLEHLKSPEIALGEFNRTLKNGGILLVSVPNTESIGLKWKGKEWFGYRDSTHQSLLSPGEWQNLIERKGFEITDIRYDGLWDIPYITRIPKSLQYITFTIPSMFLFWLGVRFPKKWGENVLFVGKKSKIYQ